MVFIYIFIGFILMSPIALEIGFKMQGENKSAFPMFILILTFVLGYATYFEIVHEVIKR